ncbi:MAG TPA: hypothetical protein VFQ38_02300 [Longimicrobiales bacterium]|nr:hypothetical protein [Longimicrobiales bacterium]
MTTLRRRAAYALVASIPMLLAAAAPAAAQRTLTPATFAGLELRNIGPANMSGRIVDLAVVETDPAVFYAASATGGVWKTVNGGVTFAPVFTDGGTHSVGAIAVSQTDTSIVWVGTGERASRQSNSWGDGVYKSTDGGRTWTNMGLRETRHIGRIAIHPTNPDIVFVAGMGHLWGPNPERGLYKTTDGGKSWKRVLAVDENTGVVDVAIDPQEPNTMYAASYQRRRAPFGFNGGGPGSALWKSTDGGETWRKLTKGLPSGEYGRIGISIYRKDPRIVYVSVEKGWRYNASTAYVRRAPDAGVFRSEDRGESWTHMGDWNPRPMYASQILVDPGDDRRIYMENTFSYSDDGGKTFKVARQSLHGDDRILWVDPRDSRHVIKGDDGGIGISWDRARTWLFVASLPVSQWYHVRVDNDTPYNVYGGLQDNGCWMGPSATYRREGVLNEDWTRTCGGDGFLSIPDTVDGRTVYAESQFLGLLKLDRETGQVQDIRPGDPHGAIEARRNFQAWFTKTPEPELLNAMAPGNWDGAYLVSPHDHATLYAGTDHLWKSVDQGETWTDLGDMTTGVDRRTLKIMGVPPHDSVPSLDDGAPYYPTVTIIAESPVEAGVLWVGTDDGDIRVSRDGGKTFTELRTRFPKLPKGAWVSGIEPSRRDAATAYVVFNNYRSDDYGNYLYRTTDAGRSWTSVTGDLPAGRVLRTVREDPRNPNVLWLAAELGLFVSLDGGAHWTQLKSNMPVVAFNDLVIHPRENDLVLASHGRGVWILDHVNAIQELTPEVLASDAHLFTIQPAAQVRYHAEKAHTGDMIFHGANPPAGATIDYWLAAARDSGTVALAVLDAGGAEVAHLRPKRAAGINRVVWNLRRDDLPALPGARRRPEGPWVAPGAYTVRLTVDGRPYEQRVDVRDDPRIRPSPEERVAWSALLDRIAEAYRGATLLASSIAPAAERARAALGEPAPRSDEDEPGDDVRAAPPAPLAPDAARRVKAVADPVLELQSRLARLYADVSDWVGAPSADQRTRLEFYEAKLKELEPKAREVVSAR